MLDNLASARIGKLPCAIEYRNAHELPQDVLMPRKANAKGGTADDPRERGSDPPEDPFLWSPVREKPSSSERSGMQHPAAGAGDRYSRMLAEWETSGVGGVGFPPRNFLNDETYTAGTFTSTGVGVVGPPASAASATTGYFHPLPEQEHARARIPRVSVRQMRASPNRDEEYDFPSSIPRVSIRDGRSSPNLQIDQQVSPYDLKGSTFFLQQTYATPAADMHRRTYATPAPDMHRRVSENPRFDAAVSVPTGLAGGIQGLHSSFIDEPGNTHPWSWPTTGPRHSRGASTLRSPEKLDFDAGKAAEKNKPRLVDNASFPVKLHSILCNPEYQDSIAWLPHGKSFRIINPVTFERDVLPKYFRSSRFASFMRQVRQRFVFGLKSFDFSHNMHTDFPYK